jgi:cellobiose-specific phosphotransferase system component IIC
MINKCNTIHFFSAIGSEPVRTINWLSFCFKLMSIVEGVLFRLPIALNSMGLVETRIMKDRLMNYRAKG